VEEHILRRVVVTNDLERITLLEEVSWRQKLQVHKFLPSSGQFK
jgi:hypothetical protein